MTKRTEPTLWVVWGLRRGFHPLEDGAWHPLFHYRSEARARAAAEQAAHVKHECLKHHPGTPEDKRHDCQKCKYGVGVWPYERFKAVPPGRLPVRPEKVRSQRRRKPCGRCHTMWLPKVWKAKRRCEVCGWVPPPYRQRARAAA